MLATDRANDWLTAELMRFSLRLGADIERGDAISIIAWRKSGVAIGKSM
jgi:hypothetical protein